MNNLIHNIGVVVAFTIGTAIQIAPIVGIMMLGAWVFA